MDVRFCTVEGCSRPLRAKGLCATHWGRMRRHGRIDAGFSAYDYGKPTLDKVFWSRVRKSDGCWEWVGARSDVGYGHLRFANKLHLTHRLSYEIHVGPIPIGLEICHRCDNPPCCNPAHLFAGTHSENMLDGSSRGRVGGKGTTRGVRHGVSKLNDELVRAIRSSPLNGPAAAKEFVVSTCTIYRVRKRLLWKHVV